MNVMKKSDIKIICGRIFSEHFRKLGISQKEFAAEIGVTPVSVSQFLNGKRLPSSEHLCFICIKCNYSVPQKFHNVESEKMNKKNCEFTSIHKNQNVVY